jgi:hypothetical protein
VEGGTLAEWDTRLQPNGPYTLRVVVFDQANASREGQTTIVINNPMPIATPLEPAPDMPPPPSEPEGIPIPPPEPGAPASPSEGSTEASLPGG